MLYILTGDIQIGKTRALQGYVAEQQRQGVPVYGVLSPGIWQEREAVTTDAHAQPDYEKLGIETILLPSNERFMFAKRRDLAEQDGFANATSQSAAAGLRWAINDAAIDRVNTHFAAIAAAVSRSVEACLPNSSESPNSPSAFNSSSSGLLVVDELGQLELNCNQGFTEAVKLLTAGPTQLYANAIIIVRQQLIPQALEKFKTSWGSVTYLRPINTYSE